MTQMQTRSGKAVTTLAAAETLIARLANTMDRLLEIVDQEAVLVRGGRIRELARLEPVKADLARSYVADVLQVRASAAYLKQHCPALVAALKKRHERFHALLQVNLTVLATARAVAEGIIRGVSQELTSKAAPQVYGASGVKSLPSTRHARPMAVSRAL
jgi:hypothetical protein